MKIRSLRGLATPREAGRSVARAAIDEGRMSDLPNETKIWPLSWMEMKVGGFSCALGGGGVAGGRSMRMETVARGATTMKMIKSTSITSTKGVTFMSLFC